MPPKNKQTEPPKLPEHEPWRRLPNEPNMWYDRFFRYYLPDGGERSLTGAYRKLRIEQAAANGGEIKRAIRSPAEAWTRNAKLWRWYERAELKDAAEREKIRLEEEKERSERRRERRAMIRSYQIAVANVLNKKGKRLLLEILEAGELRAGDIDRAIKTVMEQQRIEYGEQPTRKTDVTSGGEPLKTGDTIFVYGGMDLDDL